MSTDTAESGDEPSGGKLTAKQRAFVAEYVIDQNGVQAYFRAYGRNKSNGQPRSYFGANVQAIRLLQNPTIQRELRAAEADFARRVRVSKLRVLRELAMLAFVDPADAYDPDPDGGQDIPRPMSRIPAPVRRALSGSRTKRRRIVGEGQELYEVEEVEYKFSGKQAALDALCKKLGLFKDDDKGGPALTDAEKVEVLKALFGGKPEG